MLAARLVKMRQYKHTQQRHSARTWLRPCSGTGRRLSVVIVCFVLSFLGSGALAWWWSQPSQSLRDSCGQRGWTPAMGGNLLRCLRPPAVEGLPGRRVQGFLIVMGIADRGPPEDDGREKRDAVLPRTFRRCRARPSLVAPVALVDQTPVVLGSPMGVPPTPPVRLDWIEGRGLAPRPVRSGPLEWCSQTDVPRDSGSPTPGHWTQNCATGTSGSWASWDR